MSFTCRVHGRVKYCSTTGLLSSGPLSTSTAACEVSCHLCALYMALNLFKKRWRLNQYARECHFHCRFITGQHCHSFSQLLLRAFCQQSYWCVLAFSEPYTYCASCLSLWWHMQQNMSYIQFQVAMPCVKWDSTTIGTCGESLQMMLPHASPGLWLPHSGVWSAHVTDKCCYCSCRHYYSWSICDTLLGVYKESMACFSVWN